MPGRRGVSTGDYKAERSRYSGISDGRTVCKCDDYSLVAFRIRHQTGIHELLPHPGFGVGREDLIVGDVRADLQEEFVIFTDGGRIVVGKTEDHPGQHHDAVFVAVPDGLLCGGHDVALVGLGQIVL